MSKLLIVADIAGQFDALMRLVAQAPDRKIILVGDLMDRGPRSREVIEWAMNTPNVVTLKGNHEHMMSDFLRPDETYEPGIWLHNGGLQTCISYGYECQENQIRLRDLKAFMGKAVPMVQQAWLEWLPLFYQEEGLFVSHAPWRYGHELGDIEDAQSLLWNRNEPQPKEGTYQVFGHNSHWGLMVKKDWACLDASQRASLVGLLWPERTVLEVPYK